MENTVVLPGGVFLDGNCYQEVKLHPPAGKEMELLANASTSCSLASAVTTLLTHCTDRIGPLTDITTGVVRSLPAGDRDYLILKLRQMTFGNKVEATLVCPNPDCGEKVDINFQLSNIPIKQGKISSPVFTVKLPKQAAFKDNKGNKHYRVEFRLPNGGDQEALALSVEKNEPEAVNKLLARCIRKIGKITEINQSMVEKLTLPAREKIENAIEELAPQVEQDMETTCRECNNVFSFPFNMSKFFLDEMKINLDQLYWEVHFLAFYYKWSEGEILSMTNKKRRKYLELLSEHIERTRQEVM